MPGGNIALTNTRPGSFVLSEGGLTVYVALGDGHVRAYDTMTGIKTGDWVVGNKINALDLSPDGSFIIAVEAQIDTAAMPNVRALSYKLDLASGGVTNLPLVSSSTIIPQFTEAAILTGGRVYFSTNQGGNNSSMWSLDLATGSYAATSSAALNGGLAINQDRSALVLATYGISAPETYLYESAHGQVAARTGYDDGIIGYGRGATAISSTGLVANAYNTTNFGVWDAGLRLVAHPNAVPNQYPVGLAFNASGSSLYVLNGNNNIYELSIADWSIIRAIPLGFNDTSLPNYNGAELLVGPGDSYFLVRTESGLIRVDNPAVSDPVTGTASGETINGTTAGDVLFGLAGDDTLNGGDGADTLSGGDGNDIIDGGDQADRLSGDSGNDRLFGGAGDDTLIGDLGDDLLDGGIGTDTASYAFADAAVTVSLALTQSQNTVGGGTDTLTGIENLIGTGYNDTLTGDAVANVLRGGGGDDQLQGGDSDDMLFGEGGYDTLDGGAGADRMVGGIGNDTYYVDNAGDLVIEDASQGTDEVRTTLAAYALTANVERLVFFGMGATSLTGNGINNVLNGGGGNDWIDGGGGSDQMTGGLGDDTYILDSSGDRVFENANGGDDTIESSVTITTTNSANVETLRLTGTANVNASGTASVRNTIYGNSGNNSIDGGGGGDQMEGGLGNDSYLIRTSLDVVIEAANGGNDTVRASVDYTLAAGVEVEILATPSALGTGPLNLTGNEFSHDIQGNAGANVLVGGTGNDVIQGFAGDDTLNGGGGADTLIGGAGDDTYTVSDSSTVIVEAAGGGSDSIKTAVDYVLGAGVEVELIRLAPGSAALNLTGNGFSSKIIGNSNDNVLDGGGGGDTMRGGLGNDTYVVRDAADAVFEATGAGDDTVKAAVSYTLGAAAQVEHLWALDFAATTAINLTGNDYSHDIQGNAGGNVLTGGSGSDFLSGNGGADTLIGGAGDDTYLLTDSAAVIVEAVGGGSDSIKSSVNYVLGAGVEVETMRLAFGSAGLNLTGNGYSSKLIGNEGDNVLDGGGGGDVMRGGLGNDTYIVRDAADRIVELQANGAADVVQAAVSFTMTADAWVETLQTIDASAVTAINLTGNDHTLVIQGNAGANVLTGAGNETISGFAGNDTLFGGAGADRFVFASGTGQDSVGDFASGSDKLDLSAFGFASFADVQAATHNDGSGNAVIDLGGGDSVTLSGVSTAQLQSGDVILSGGGGALGVASGGSGLVAHNRFAYLPADELHALPFVEWFMPDTLPVAVF